MQSMPLLLRQSIRSSFHGLSRTTTTSSRPVRRPLLLLLPAGVPQALYPGRETTTPRSFSTCLPCQFRTQTSVYSSNEPEKKQDVIILGAPPTKDTPAPSPPPPSAIPEHNAHVESDAGRDSPAAAAAPAEEQSSTTAGPEAAEREGKKQEDYAGADAAGSGSQPGGLPSYLENRRSQFAKQFSVVMDNLQSNIFVAGQRLNDLTGYSAIEALKKDIQFQEERLRAARLQVRTAKDAYAAAINNRSTSQREVNELLQRKHAWSAADLERFTHLYRNDHTNEVAENEAQQALTAAEHEAEEAGAQLNKSILSRYHEEQVWSDKIRRMSTWGTWGLMGVNVLLFLIFQIAVEPWRRKRLVKGFEEKVIEAIEKEKTLNQAQILNLQTEFSQQMASASANRAEAAAAAAEPAATSAGASTEEATTAIVASEAIPNEQETNPALPASAPVPPETETQAAPPVSNHNTDNNKLQNVLQTCKTHYSRIPPYATLIESSRRYLRDLFSDRQITMTQRDHSVLAIQSAAAGAAVIGLLAFLIRPQ
ncbi:hypothetical protein ASPACDRAFT_59208 [Aspergillus aculeatus ATCC 16872]|uniref:Sensitive to high expression protein 9, mitochondrial n=1 Tax=Aspergillus aculeatus (strain ATCC 16872 / CBS 172.66 / WB 5094) TaxID=690307 RepID=A0A1L9X054_ASPA1|nr:uncharacterized protein ASPACDRAFT_59208 [Aspergillus aculeatus ATCC 16872]OJK01518.1 hypothetical protein ASPACDRAFT_59208 [Aspergillus aculeatus ATCC 16872]